MKILAIHNFHLSGSASGDDVVFKQETAMLEAKGHQVLRYSTKNDAFDNAGALGKLMSAFGMFWSFRHYRQVKALIRAEQPDYIFLTGDLLDQYRQTSHDYAVELCSAQAEIAPTYFVTGNLAAVS